MKKQYIDYVIYIAVALAVYFFIYKKFFSPATKSREFLHTLGFGIADRMTDDEAIDAASYIRDYTQRGIKVSPGSAFAYRINAIAKKYNIFT